MSKKQIRKELQSTADNLREVRESLVEVQKRFEKVAGNKKKTVTLFGLFG